MLTKPFKLETGELNVYEPIRGKYKSIKAGEPENIRVWTPDGEITYIFIKYTDFKDTVMFRIKSEDVEEFNTWFRENYGKK